MALDNGRTGAAISTEFITTRSIPKEIQIELDILKKDIEELKNKVHMLQILTMF